MSYPKDILTFPDPDAPPRVVGPRRLFEKLLVERHERGADRHDEVWEGEIRLNATPSQRHYRLEHDLYAWLRGHVEAHELGRTQREGKPAIEVRCRRHPEEAAAF